MADSIAEASGGLAGSNAVDLPRPDRTLPHLADVMPSVLAAMGAPDSPRRISLPNGVSGACVLLIDGLGAELLEEHAADAPVLAAMRRSVLSVGFPSTTVAGLAAVGTGCHSGGHGMVGYTFRLPDVGVINALQWRPHPHGGDLRAALPPETVQPMATTFERATAAGFAVSVVSKAEFAGSGLTRAALRGARYVGVQGVGDLAAGIQDAVSDRGFCFGYHGDLDLIGHLHGPGSLAWRLQLRQVDRLVESVVEGLPPGGLLAVVADHGMVGVTEADRLDVDADADLLDGVSDVGGEARARHVYAEDGAADAVLATWREIVGDRAWVVSREEAIAAEWFGDRIADGVRERIGDVVAAARGSAVLVRRTVEPLESALSGHHGSLTSAEQLVPLLLAYG